MPHVNRQPQSSFVIFALYTCRAQYPIWHGGAPDGLDITSSQPRGANDIAVFIELNPATADTRLHGGTDVNHVRIFASRHHLSGQSEVESSGFACLRLGVEDRCFDLSIDKQSDSISANSQAVADAILEKFCASIRTSAALIGRPVRSFTTPSTEVPAAALNEPLSCAVT
jgi:hypothetical protein